jgi:hypothetical protein
VGAMSRYSFPNMYITNSLFSYSSWNSLHSIWLVFCVTLVHLPCRAHKIKCNAVLPTNFKIKGEDSITKIAPSKKAPTINSRDIGRI